MEFQNIKKRHITFNVGEREITLRLFKKKQTMGFFYGVTYAIRSPEDKGKFSKEKEKEIVKQILDGRQKKRVFLTYYYKEKPELKSELSNITSNVMTYEVADVILKNLAKDMTANLQNYVPFKV